MPEKYYTNSDGRSAASKFGQMIGEAFERVIFALIQFHLDRQYPDYEFLAPEQGSALVTLDMLGGLARQLDTVITAKDSTDPVALLETKWLKDARHHNDKGAWMLQLREIRKKYATVRGAAAILAGYWTEGVGVMLMGEGGVKMVLVATDEEIYSTLQKPLNQYPGGEAMVLEAAQMRERYPVPWTLANFMIDLHEHGQLDVIAKTWLNFGRVRPTPDQLLTGGDLVKIAIDDLLAPLPQNPGIQALEIALQINTGHTIYQEFTDAEAAVDFIQTYFRNPQAILDRILPRKKS